MNLYSLQYSTKTNIVVSSFAIVAMIFLTYFPAIIMNLITSNGHKLQSHNVKEEIGDIYEETRFESKTIMNQFFIPIFLFRRFIYVLILVLLIDYPLL